MKVTEIKKITDNELDTMLSRTGDMSLRRLIATIVADLNLADTEDKVLDCGCGEGLHLSILRNLTPCELFGLDLDRENLKKVKRELGDDAYIIQGDIVKLPFKNGTFDKIFCSEVLEHVSNDVAALKELKRVLRKDGLLIITVPNRNYPFLWDPINKALEKLTGKHIENGFWAGFWLTHLRLYHVEELRELVERTGFEVVSMKALTYYCFPFNHLILNGIKRLMVKGVIPHKISRLMDRAAWKQPKSSFDPILWIFRILVRFDRLNDNIPINKPSCSIEVVAKKRDGE